MTPTDTTGDRLDKTLVSDLRPDTGETVTYFLCSEKEVATDRNGKSYLRLKLRDSSGEVKAIHFDPSDEALGALAAGDVVKVRGSYGVHPQYGPQFQVRRLRRLVEGEYDPSTLIPVSPVPVGELRARLGALVASLADPGLQALLERALDESREPGSTFAVVPAAVRNHHAYRHGLLEHSLMVAEVAADVAGRLPGVDRDLTVAGALLHDIGKVRAYSADPMAPGLTDDGRLEGEIVIGLEIVRDLVAEVPGFPADSATGLRHIVAAHHGEVDKGSPVTPKTREAIVVHFCDDMTARIAAFDEAARTAGDDRWSAYSRMLETSVYLGGRDAAADAAAPAEATPDAPSNPAEPTPPVPVTENATLPESGTVADDDPPPTDRDEARARMSRDPESGGDDSGADDEGERFGRLFGDT